MYRLAWLSISAILCAAACCAALADDLILLPTGATLTTGQYRGEVIISPESRHGNFEEAAVGLESYEFNYMRADYGQGKVENKFGVQWCFLPETFITPAVSIGVRDLFSQSAEGFGGYAALTKSVPVGPLTNLISDVSLTVGFGIRSLRGPFGGVEVKFLHNLVAQAEYDGDNWNTAFGWQPTETLRLKTYKLNKERYYGVELIPLAW
jgi:hypothetical protein